MSEKRARRAPASKSYCLRIEDTSYFTGGYSRACELYGAIEAAYAIEDELGHRPTIIVSVDAVNAVKGGAPLV